MITLGLDIGSRNTKAVLWDASSGEILASGICSTDVDPLKSVAGLKADLQSQHPDVVIEQSGWTGYGRKLSPHPVQVFSEILCHAAGVSHIIPNVQTIIDMGGQDSKIISLHQDCRVKDFLLNDKCAAGTGRFLEMTSLRLGLSLSELSNPVQLSPDNALAISSTCVVFAESEIIGMVAKGQDLSSIINAVNNSIVNRLIAQLSSMEFSQPLVFTGGVAQNSGLVKCLSHKLGFTVLVPPDPEITGALGAALLATK